jgi:hypothetical protein
LLQPVGAPTTERLIQVEATTVLDIPTHAPLQIGKPITRHINKRSYKSRRDARSNKHDPYLRVICKLPQLSYKTRSRRLENS